MVSIWMLLLLALIAMLVIRYHWQRRHLYICASKLPGPLALPIIGNFLMFFGKTEDTYKRCSAVAASYPKPFRFWFGPYLAIWFSDPHHIEKILSSSKLAYKHDVYDQFFKIYIGDGLVSNSGPKYKKHRKLIQPLLNVNFVTGNLEKIQKHIDVLLEKLDLHVNREAFDIHDAIHFCLADIIGESVFGTNIEAQDGKNSDYIESSVDMYKVCYKRATSPWLYPDILYNMTEEKKHQTRIIKNTTTFVKKVVEKAWQRLAISEYEIEQSSPIVDQIADIIRKDPNAINKEDFMYHMYTLYVASEDTITLITSMLCMCLGMYPEYQELAAEEIHGIFGDTPREVTYDDITKMQYLDMCIRDVLRLIPIAPFLVRKSLEVIEIDGLIIPPECAVIVPIFDIHRDPTIWEVSNDFYPNHFLPEKVRKRHPFAYIPFSAGSRSCVGKVLAMIGLKLIAAKILQKFEIEADGKFSDVELKADISVRSGSGYNIRLKPRKWK